MTWKVWVQYHAKLRTELFLSGSFFPFYIEMFFKFNVLLNVQIQQIISQIIQSGWYLLCKLNCKSFCFSSLLKPLEILLVQNAILTRVLCYKQITTESSILVVRNGRLPPFYFYSTRNRPRMALTMGMKKQRNSEQCLHTAISFVVCDIN